MDQLQFYPTPPSLAHKAWKKFKNRDFQRVLDPSAGNGDLLKPFEHDPYHSRLYRSMDALEIDPARHPILKDKGIKVVGLDFEQFDSGAIYSHIIMNPPFARGCEHVLRAWDILFDGEIVAIINAETLRNPLSADRRRLARLVERSGSVEFIKEAFKGDDVQREAEVEIALVHLVKQADTSSIVTDIFKGLREDEARAGGTQYRQEMPLALPNNFVENVVIMFKAAVEAMRRAVAAQAQSNYYASLLGDTMAVRNAEQEGPSPSQQRTAAEFVRNTVAKEYDELKDRAWAHILKSTQVAEKLSSKAQKRLEAEFENIKRLEFSAANIYGFLEGISNAGWDLQIEMVCDVFDQITRYHSENVAFYMGWKSNDRHRAMGMRVKMTRFVLPRHRTESYNTSFSYETERLLADFDKVFAMLDGKAAPALPMVATTRNHFKDLREGKRVKSSYFDLRHFPGVGTIHFFPTRKDLVDRLNRLVGQHRRWLPPATEQASEGFWVQFEQAEKLDPEYREAFTRGNKGSYWQRPDFNDLTREDADRVQAATTRMLAACAQVHEAHGIEVDAGLQHSSGEVLAIEMA